MEHLLALSASAGSGKTFSLVARYLSLIFEEVNPSEILAITFTNKAADEMRDRVMNSLECLHEDMASEVSRLSGIPLVKLEQKRKRLLDRFLDADLNIMTIDSFFNKILRKFCWYAGVQSDFIVKSMPKEDFFERYLKSLSHSEYRFLVDFAKLQSKKSSSFIEFFELMYEKDKEIPFFDIKSEIFSEDEPMKIANKIAEFFLDSNISKRAKNTMRFSSVAEVVSQKWFLRDSFNYWDFKKGYDPIVDIWLKELKESIRIYYIKKERDFLSKVLKLYQKYKSVRLSYLKEASELHFKDIEHFVYDLLRDSVLTDFLYFRLDAKVGHILFDEFQDTSVTQYKIFEPILEEIASQQEGRTLFYVGDTKQSIYRFRGGQKELFGYVAEKFGVKVEHLRINYRSKSNIVEFVNSVFDYVKPPQKAKKEGGFVKVMESEVFDGLESSLKELFKAGVDDDKIAILVHDNKEILEVSNFLKDRFKKTASTHKRAKVVEQPSAKAIVELMKLIYEKKKGRSGNLHRLNFLSLIGKGFDPEFMPDIKGDRAFFMVKEIMDRYSLFDDAAMKLLEFSMGFGDLTDFIYGIDSYDEELPSAKVGGINLLTIHKSKGLEFDYVIVLDRIGRSKSNASPFIFDYEGIDLKDIRVKFKSREAVDSEYAKAVEKDKKLEAEDALNRTYVAFTRAKSALVIIKKPTSSAFGNLSLREYEAGRLEIFKKEQVIKSDKQPLSYKPVDFGRQEVFKEEKRYRANDYEAIYFGLGVHYLFENEDIDALVNRYGYFCDTKRVKELVKISNANIEYNFLIEGKQYREFPFVYKKRLGIIDLLVEKEDSIVIVDYKTSTPSDISAYKEQMAWYKEAIASIFKGKKELKSYIFFLDSQKILSL